MSKFDTAAKSTASSSPLPTTDTVTVVATSRAAWFTVAVTVTAVAPASSVTLVGDALSRISVDATSLSSIVPVAVPSAIVTDSGLESVISKFSSPSTRPSCAISTEMFAAVSPGDRVSVPDVSS